MGSSLSTESSGNQMDVAICTIDQRIAFRIFDFSDTRTLLNWMATCRTLQATTKQYIAQAFDMNIIYRKFFDTDEDILIFRRQMAKAGALVSGSQVVQYFSRSHYAGSDLDLYVHHLESEYIAICLLELGYKYVPSRSKALGWSQLCDEACEMAVDETYGGMLAVLNFFNRKHMKIQVMITSVSPLETILRFHSTIVMNFFTATEAFSLYPYASFIRNINLLCKATDRSTKQAVLKYIDRGYNLKALVTTKPQKSFCAWTTRRPGDRHTWRIRDHVDVGQTHTPVEGNTWKLRSVQGTIHAQPIYDIFRHRRLKVPIVTSDYMSVQHWFELRTARKRPIGRRSKAEESLDDVYASHCNHTRFGYPV